MKQLNVSLFKSKINAFMDEVFFHSERYIIMKNGKKRAVIMSLKEYEELEEYIRDSDDKREIK